MNRRTSPILAKSPSSGSKVEKVKKAVYNAVTAAAHKEAMDIMNGKKKTKSYTSAEEFLADLKS